MTNNTSCCSDPFRTQYSAVSYCSSHSTVAIKKTVQSAGLDKNTVQLESVFEIFFNEIRWKFVEKRHEKLRWETEKAIKIAPQVRITIMKQ
jgi:hypothetical protein